MQFGSLALRRRLMVVVIAAGGVFGVSVAHIVIDEQLPVFIAGVPVLAAGSVALVLFALLRAYRVAHPVSAALVAAAVGLLAATPVSVRWSDGCNDHTAQVAVLAAPFVLLVEPQQPRFAYLEYHTLVGCADSVTPVDVPIGVSSENVKIRRVYGAFESAWGRHDPHRLCRMLAPQLHRQIARSGLSCPQRVAQLLRKYGTAPATRAPSLKVIRVAGNRARATYGKGTPPVSFIRIKGTWLVRSAPELHYEPLAGLPLPTR